MIDSSFLLDSSAWLAYFFAENKEIARIIEEGNILFSSSISLFEIKRKLTKDRILNNKINSIIKFIKERSIIINIDSYISEIAVDISIKHKLSAIDSVIYTSALFKKAKFVTLDSDFKEMKDIILLS